MKHSRAVFSVIAFAFACGLLLSPCFGQDVVSTYNGQKITIPESSIPHAGRLHTNYFLVGDGERTPEPPPNAETPASLACVYQLVQGPAGCPIATSTNVPTGGIGAIAIVDAGDYPTAAADLHAFSAQFGIPDADFTVVYADGKKPPVYLEWLTEEALDIEWSHAMAPKAKLFLVVSTLQDTDPTWQAVAVAGKLVSENGGGVVSMSWGDPEAPNETQADKLFIAPNVVYFAASGDSGIGVSIYPGSSPNVISVGGTFFVRNSSNGDFEEEIYGGGGGDLSPYEPRPAYQDVISNIVGTQRGYPDVASDFCCAAVYLQGEWESVAGTSWSSPTFAGIVNASGHFPKTSYDAHTALYNEYANQQAYKDDYFYDITQGSSYCMVGWDECAGIGTPRTYQGK
jgi:subtilase family serine protease